MSITIIDLDVLSRLRELIGGRADDLAELINEFISDTPSLLNAMRTAHKEKNWHALRLAAHTLKSNARDLGALTLWPLCAELEMACKDGVPANTGAKLNAIEIALNAAHDSLYRIEPSSV